MLRLLLLIVMHYYGLLINAIAYIRESLFNKSYYYNLLTNNRTANTRTNLGNTYLEKAYIKNTIIPNVNTT
jgi:hypothetical protein